MRIRKTIIVILAISAIILGTVLLAAASGNLMDINKATVEDLVTVKGIGQKKAETIVSFITERGGLASMDDLTEVKGVGPKLLEELKKHFEVKEREH
jgi:competence protein ComEA